MRLGAGMAFPSKTCRSPRARAACFNRVTPPGFEFAHNGRWRTLGGNFYLTTLKGRGARSQFSVAVVFTLSTTYIVTGPFVRSSRRPRGLTESGIKISFGGAGLSGALGYEKLKLP